MEKLGKQALSRYWAPPVFLTSQGSYANCEWRKDEIERTYRIAGAPLIFTEEDPQRPGIPPALVCGNEPARVRPQMHFDVPLHRTPRQRHRDAGVLLAVVLGFIGAVAAADAA